MDFYGNDYVMAAESRHRTAELQRDARRSVAPSARPSAERDGWSRKFTEWVVAKARMGSRFMARYPASS